MGKSNYNFKKLHPFKWFILQNYPFLEDSIDVLTNYQLFCKLGEMINNQVAPINEMGEQVETLTNAFNDLYDWFEKLDVQDEVNNKLDEMAESGELEELIGAYLNTKAILCFDTVADMKESINLINGSYARTLGYYEKNDGGEAIYKIREITNDDVVDEIFIIEMSNDNNLVAELILKDSYINSNQAGMKANDNTFNNTPKLETLLEKCNSKGLNIELNKGVYYFSTPVTLNYRLQAIHIKGQGLPYTGVDPYINGTTLKYSGTGWFITFASCWKCTFEEFQVESNENGLKFGGVFFMSYLNKVHFLNCKNAILLKQFAYAHLNQINITTNNSSSEYALKVGEETTDLTEYLYVDGFINEDSEIYSGNNGIVINKGIHLDFKNMDFVKKYNAIVITPIELTRYLFFDNVDIARCHIGYNINALNSFSYIKIENSMCSFREDADSTDRFILIDKASGKLITNLITENIGSVALDPTVKPDYMIEILKTFTLNHSSISIDYNPNDIHSKVFLADNEENVLTNYYQKLNKVNRFFHNNASTKTVTLTLLTNSPFNQTPWVEITANRPVIKSYTVSNTNGGNLTATVTLSDDFTTGTYILFSKISTGAYEQKSVS